MSIDSPAPDRQPDEPRGPRDHRGSVGTYVYDGQGQLVSVLRENGQGPTTSAASPLPFHWEHIPDKRLFAMTGDASTEYWHDNPTRYLVVELDPTTGKNQPVLKWGRPVYLWLCREEREGR